MRSQILQDLDRLVDRLCEAQLAFLALRLEHAEGVDVGMLRTATRSVEAAQILVERIGAERALYERMEVELNGAGF